MKGPIILSGLLATCTLANNVVHLPIAKNFEAEAAIRRRQSGKGIVPVPLENALYLYYANATVGSPPQAVSLQIDTGSSDTWVPFVGASICTESDQCNEGTCK
jgi:hypothetical protein